MKQKYVIDLSMRYMGEFESEDKARYAAIGWAIDYVPDGIIVSICASSVRSAELILQDAANDAEPSWPMKNIILDTIRTQAADQKTHSKI